MAGPYILTKPADIAMEYGGNKKEIARAAQMGMLDPTAAVLAGMFIDRMRNAQQEEISDETVAEETFAAPQMAMAPQMGMPSEMPQEGGVGLDSLPVPESAFTAAEGGIVAFENGGDVDYSQYGDLGEELKRQEELRRLFLGENEALKAEREGMDAARSEQRAMRLIEAGLGIAGGASPYFAENLKGALPAVKGYGEDVAAQRKRQAELAGMERAEKGKVLESAMGEVRAREKNTPETIREARALQAEAREAGRKVPTLAEAIKMIQPTTGTATLQAAFVGSKKDAAKAVNELLSSNIFKADLKKIKKEQGEEAAEAYKRQRIRETVGLFPGVDPDQVMSVVGGSGAAAPRAKPTLSEFLAKARERNPGVSDGELTKFYNEKYGK